LAKETIMTILDTIVEHKKKEIASCKGLISVGELEKAAHFKRNTLSMKDFLLDPQRTGIIAEFKRKSPSKGIINSVSTVADVTSGYAQQGASALSVLTDFLFFGGSADDLLKAREVSSIPILRKEFIIDDYQIFEAKALGADAILLIAAILSPDECKTLAGKAHVLGLQVLLEIHDETELDRLNENIDLIGVNNRNLSTFEVDLSNSTRLVNRIPHGIMKISESGISTAEDILYLKQQGFTGFLIGENFMKTHDPVEAFSKFVNSLHSKTKG
jgi:indole-3-glycerol phosphate synthase